jgi:murein L,D-transpeptidase YafK
MRMPYRSAFACLLGALVGLLAIGLPLACVAKARLAVTKEPVPVERGQPVAATIDAQAEARLLEVYQLMGSGRSHEALEKAGAIVQKYPHFQLAQLVYGDLLAARVRPVKTVGDVPPDVAALAGGALGDLREESQKRVKALYERPRPGTIPSQFLEISKKTRYAIAVDTSRSRLYLFENRAAGLNLVADYYTSVGKAGVAKAEQGDQRTPLGVYYITSHLDARSLKDFYGSGALPINYPNMLDAKRGKTGSGIWLHGTPPGQFSRAPLATDGCLVMANPDLKHLIETVEIGRTPVVIAPQLQWVDPLSAAAQGKPFQGVLQAWRNAKVEGNMNRLLSFYAPDFNAYGKTLEQWSAVLKSEVAKTQGHPIELKDLSLLRWTDSADTMVVTFGEVPQGQRTGWTKRQYWSRQGGEWKIFFEGAI